MALATRSLATLLPSLRSSPSFYYHRRDSFSSAATQRLKLRNKSSSVRIHSGMGDIVPSIVCYVTVPNKETGKKLAEGIITERLAGCVNQVPGVVSTYWWDNKIETDAEELLIIKTRESLLDALTAHVKANHPYEVPEVIALPIVGGSHDYLKWLKENTKA